MPYVKGDFTIFSYYPYLSINDGDKFWKHPEVFHENLQPTDNLALITTHAWTPGVYRFGKRVETLFKEAHYGALDFDDGKYTIAKACVEWNDYEHVLGVTKSHTSEHPRFRIVFRWIKAIKSVKEYRFNMINLINQYGADPACKDAARFFWPCQWIVAQRKGASCQQVAVGDPPQEFEKTNYDNHVIYRGSGMLPPWIYGALHYGVADGTRNKECFKIAANLTELGWREDQIIDTLMGSKIPIDNTHETQREVVNVVASAVRKVGRR